MQFTASFDQRSPKTNLAIRYRARDGLPTGRLLRRGADASQDADWWGEIELDQARLDWDKPVTLDGRLRARMKDVSLLLDVYDRPEWLKELMAFLQAAIVRYHREREAAGALGQRAGGGAHRPHRLWAYARASGGAAS